MALISVGIDLGVTAKHEAYVLGPAGKKAFRFTTTSGELDELIHLAQSTAEHPSYEIIFILEPTAKSWVPVTRYLTDRNYRVFSVNAKKVKDYRSYLHGRKKTDKLDAKVLAAMGRDHEALTPIILPSEATMVLQRLTRERVRLQEQASGEKKRLRSLCHEVIPGLTQLLGMKLYEKAWREFLKKFINPFDIMRAGQANISEFLLRHGAKLCDLDVVPAIHAYATEACKTFKRENMVYFQAMVLSVRNYIDMLEMFENRVEEYDELIAVHYPEVHPSKVIETIPGIGSVLAPVIVATIGDHSRFTNAKQVRAYSGYIPAVSESGERSAQGLKITKQGPNNLKRALYLAADSARRWDIELATVYYKSMMEKGHCHTQAVCAVANHLAGRIYTILKEDRPYIIRDPQGKPITKTEANQYITSHLRVPEEVRQRTRNSKKAKMERLKHPHKRQSKTPQASVETSLRRLV